MFIRDMLIGVDNLTLTVYLTVQDSVRRNVLANQRGYT